MAWPELQRPEVYYPESDGKPMAETDIHRDLMLELIETMAWFHRDDPEFYVSGNLFIYYEEGNPLKSVAPDFFVVRGVPKRQRRVYKIWEEKKGPNVVIELSSISTASEDLGPKRTLYERLGVLEYFMFDPEGMAFEPAFSGFIRKGETFQPLAPLRAEKGKLIFYSEFLGLELHGHGQSLRFVDPQTGELLANSWEARQLAENERRRAEAEAQRFDLEKRRADLEKHRADLEKQRADALAAELARLKKGGAAGSS